MPDKISIRELQDKNDPAFTEVGSLFQSMYAFMQKNGLQLTLAEDGSEKWLKGIKQSLGRFGVIFISSEGDTITGFAHGSIRLAPDYLGNRKLGAITHVFVNAEAREKGSGRALVHALENWFKEKEVHSIELQVLSANKNAIEFWNKLGYPAELIQNRKMAEDL